MPTAVQLPAEAHDTDNRSTPEVDAALAGRGASAAVQVPAVSVSSSPWWCPRCRRRCRRRCSCPPTRTTPSSGRPFRRLDRGVGGQGRLGRRSRCPRSRSAAAPVRCPSCRCTGRRRCSCPPTRTTPTRWRTGSIRRPRAGAPRPPSSARGLGQQQPLFVARAVVVVADGGAVARRRARHRDREGSPGFDAALAGRGASTVAQVPAVWVSSSPWVLPEVSV